MVLPSGFALPPLPYLVAVAAAVLAVGWLLVREARSAARPARGENPGDADGGAGSDADGGAGPDTDAGTGAGQLVTDRTVLAFGPWMVLGSSLYVCFQLELYPAVVAPFFGSPTVYASTFAVAGATWLVARRTARPLAALAGVGGVLAAVPVVAALRYALRHGSLNLFWPLAAVAAAAVLGHVAWWALEQWRPVDADTVGAAGALAVFGHVLDGTSTAVGVDVLGAHEQTPLSRYIMEFAAGLPTAPLLGTGWLFVLVKVAVAAGVVVLLADFVREDATEGYLVLAVVAAVGLGPGVHNVLLFVAANPAGF